MSGFSPTAPETGLNTATAGDQSVNSLSVLSGGREVVAWIDQGSGAATAKLRVVGADGVPVTAELTVGAAIQVQTAALKGGGFVVTWVSDDGTNAAVHARLYDAAGVATGADQLLATYSDTLARAYAAYGLDVASLTTGGFAVTWAVESHDNFFIRDVGRNLVVADAAGDVLSQSGESLNMPSKTLPAYDPGLTAVELANGQLMVTWWVRPTSTEFGGQRVQLYDVGGQPITAALQLDRGFPLDGGAKAEGPDLDAAVLADGRVVFAWASGGNVLYSIYSADGLGQHVIDDRTAPQIAGAGSGAPEIAVLADGRFAIAWEGSTGADPDVLARIFSATGAADGAAFHLGDVTSGVQDTALIAALANGGLAAAWRGPDADGVGVKLQNLAPDAAQGPHVHLGSSGDEALAGGAGEDWLYGGVGSDTLSGGFGADIFILSEGAGSDRVLDFTRGADHLQLFAPSGELADGTRGLLIFDPATGRLSWDGDSDAGPGAPDELAVLAGVTALARGDFAAGFQPSALRILQPGGREEIVFDWGSASWDHTVADFNAAGAPVVFSVFNDDGSSWTKWFDDASTQTWDSRSAQYDTAGALVGYQVAFDDGHQTAWSFDPQNLQPWQRMTDEYDAVGHLLSRAWVYDDGSAKVATFDVNNAQPWDMQAEIFDPAGRRIALWTYMDDGTFVG